MASSAVILVDTDVLIAHLRGSEPARAWLRQARATGPLAVSVVSVAEATADHRWCPLATPHVRRFPMFVGLEPPFSFEQAGCAGGPS